MNKRLEIGDTLFSEGPEGTLSVIITEVTNTEAIVKERREITFRFNRDFTEGDEAVENMFGKKLHKYWNTRPVFPQNYARQLARQENVANEHGWSLDNTQYTLALFIDEDKTAYTPIRYTEKLLAELEQPN
ncbi:hypothetical protein GO755_33380 [Spirosoma sp. HMF4905]|uniref:Uncharacterized protein n=1 Tax=Spirosoma arboris TaxID=2682092 RepID=A0A7K1SMG7_9BACT|nr:hypothetical protein [Spirosoma arboris]MVM34968.1 hypothetical protein [Spirosoma arboris]